VFYMGLASLPEIVARLRAAGAGGDHPAAVIAQATLPAQQIVRGTLADIVARAHAQRVTPPALLIVGNVAAFAATADASGFTAVASTPAVVAGALA
jgi:siroheme synthase